MSGKSNHAVGDILELPELGHAVVRQVRRGRLGSTISRLRLDDDKTFYLKEAEGEAAEDLQAEVLRLEWLKGRLPVPAIYRLPEADDGVYRVLLETMPGRPSHYARLPEIKRIDILAQALREIHALPVDGCPFRDTLEDELVEAERRLTLGKLDVEAFLEATEGLTPSQALDRLQEARGLISEGIFTHGDYCLPNVMIQKGQLSGIIDWGIAGVADPHRDFMAIVGSIEFNLGTAWVDRFFEAYGGPKPDQERIRYYILLDQFFAHYRP